MASPELKRIRAHLKNLSRKRVAAKQDHEAGLEYWIADEFSKVDPRVMEIDADVGIQPILADSGVPCEWIRKQGCDSSRRLLYLHGGGWCGGSLKTYRPICARISTATGCSVLAVDYRLAPKHPYPAALADSVAAYAWMCINDPGGESEARHTFIAGDSAGGNLALATLLALRERDLRMPTAAAGLSPKTDLTGIWAELKMLPKRIRWSPQRF